MPINVQIEGMGMVQFPDGTSEDVMQNALKKHSEEVLRKPTYLEKTGQLREKVAEKVQPILDVIGMTGGALLGGGPLSPVTSIPAAGGGLAIARQAGDVIRGPQNVQANRIMAGKPRYANPMEVVGRVTGDVAEGMGYQMLPEVGAEYSPYLKKYANTLLPQMPPSANQMAGDALLSASERAKTGPYLRNTEEARKLENAIPGWTATPGEAADKKALLKLQRTATTKTDTELDKEHIAANQQALRGHLGKKFSGEQGAATTQEAIRGKQSKLATEEGQASKDLFDELSKFKPEDKQATGKVLEKVVGTQRAADWDIVQQKYQAVGDPQTNVINTAKEVNKIKRELKPGMDQFFPHTEIGEIEQVLPKQEATQIIKDPKTGLNYVQGPSPSETSFQKMVKIDQMLTNSISDFSKGANPNRRMVRYLERLKTAVNQDMDLAMKGNPAYKEAKAEMTKYADKYREGSVEEMLRAGRQFREGSPGPMNLSYEEIGNKFWSPSGADDLIRAVGKETATPIMESHAVNELIQKGVINQTTGEVNSRALEQWVRANKDALGKYDLWGKFNTVERAGARFDAAKVRLDEFSKSAAAKFLNADPEQAIASALKGDEGIGPSNSAGIMRSLMNEVRNDPDAIRGLKNSFKDFIIKQAESTAETIQRDSILGHANMKKAMGKYDGAMRVLFADEPDKITALENVRKAIETNLRSQVPLAAGRPDTAESLMAGESALSNAAKQMTVNSIARKIPFLKSYLNEEARHAAATARVNVDQMWKLINQAMYDPEMASLLMESARTPDAAKAVTRQINYRMTPSVGVVARDTASELLAPSDKKRSETFQKMDQEDQKKKQALANRTLQWTKADMELPQTSEAATEPKRATLGENKDYDMDAYIKSGAPYPLPPGQHYPDTYKKDTHITKGDWRYLDKDGKKMPDIKEDGSPNPGGTWHFYPTETNLKYHTPEEYQKYFKEQEKGSVLHLPLSPAVKTDNGIISDGPGYSHDALTAKNNLADVEDNARGFTLDGKTFLDRKQALEWVKANEPDVYEKVKKKSEKEGLHSGDYAKAKGIKRKKPGVIEDD